MSIFDETFELYKDSLSVFGLSNLRDFGRLVRDSIADEALYGYVSVFQHNYNKQTDWKREWFGNTLFDQLEVNRLKREDRKQGIMPVKAEV